MCVAVACCSCTSNCVCQPQQLSTRRSSNPAGGSRWTSPTVMLCVRPSPLLSQSAASSTDGGSLVTGAMTTTATVTTATVTATSSQASTRKHPRLGSNLACSRQRHQQHAQQGLQQGPFGPVIMACFVLYAFVNAAAVRCRAQRVSMTPVLCGCAQRVNTGHVLSGTAGVEFWSWTTMPQGALRASQVPL